MFVRRTQTRATANGERYFTHRLVCSQRNGARVRQRTLLNLGRHFAVPPSDWRLLCSRVEQILSSQHALPLADVPREIEREANCIAAQLLARQVALPGAEKPPEDATDSDQDLRTIDIDSLELLRPRSVGVEQVGLWAMEQVQLIPLLKRLGFNGRQCELGLRPIFHQKPHRCNGHLFITVLAYQLVQVIRRQLRGKGEPSSWHTLRSILGGQQRVTCTFRCADGGTLHVRKATRAEPDQRAIYDALGVDPAPGGIKKLVVA